MNELRHIHLLVIELKHPILCYELSNIKLRSLFNPSAITSFYKVLTRSKLNCKIAFDAMLNSCCIALSHLKCLRLHVKINAFYSYCFLLIGIATCHKPHDFAPLFEKVHQSLYRENPQKWYQRNAPQFPGSFIH